MKLRYIEKIDIILNQKKGARNILYWSSLFLCIFLVRAFCGCCLEDAIDTRWDPATMFCNQLRLLKMNQDYCSGIWISNVVGALWLLICPTKRILYCWFYLGGALIVTCEWILIVAVLNRFISVKNWKSISWLLPVFPYCVFYQYIGYVTVPLLLGILYMLVLSSIINEYKIYKLTLLAFLAILMGMARLNMFVIFPFSIVFLYVIWYEHLSYKDMIIHFFIYIIITITIYCILAGIHQFLFNIENRDLGKYGLMLIITKLRESKDGYVFNIIIFCFFLLLFILIKPRIENKFDFQKIILISAIIFFVSLIVFDFSIFIFDKIFESKTYFEHIIRIAKNPKYIEKMNQLFLRFIDYLSYLPVFMLLFARYFNLKQWTSLNILHKKRIILCMLFMYCFQFCFLFGSNIRYRLFISISPVLLIFSSYFIFWWWGNDKAVNKCLYIVMMFLFSVFILIKIQNWDNPQGFNILKSGISYGMLTYDKTQEKEYRQAVDMIQRQLPKNALCFEYIPSHYSRWLPASVAAGGINAIPYWAKWTDNDFNNTQYVIKWHNNSKFKHEVSCNYYVGNKEINLEEILNQFIGCGDFQKIDNTNTCELWMRK